MAYAYYRTITTDHSQCGASDSVNFPILVQITNNSLKLVGSGGHINNTDTSNGQTVPADLAFYSSLGPSGLLNFDIKFYDGSTGTLIAFVTLSTLSHTSNNVIYMYYDDASVTTFQGNVNGTWDSTFVGVWHFPNGSSLSLNDSTVNAFTLTGETLGSPPTATTGIIGGGGANFSQTFDTYVYHLASALFDSLSLTLSSWVKTSSTGDFQEILCRDHAAVARLWQFRIEDTGGVRMYAGYNGSFDVTAGSNIEDGNWHLVHAVVSNSGKTGTIYIDGVAVGSDTSGTAIGQDSSIRLYGYAFTTDDGANITQGFIGDADELRYSNASRSADWILAEYNNQKSGSTFITVGAETPAGGGGSTQKSRVFIIW